MTIKIMIEVNGGLVSRIISTGDLQVYVIDHDNLEGEGREVDDIDEDLKNARIPDSPDKIVSEDWFTAELGLAIQDHEAELAKFKQQLEKGENND